VSTLLEAPPSSQLERAREIHQRVGAAAPYFEYYGYDSLFKESGGAQCDLEKLDDAGIRAFGIAVGNGNRSYFQVGPNQYEVAGNSEWARARILKEFRRNIEEIKSCPRVRIVQNAADLESDNGTIGVIPLVTGHSYMTDVEVLDEMFALGLRISHCAGNFCTTWNRATPTCEVAGEIAPIFTEFGRQIIERMNELGIVIDVAHMSDESTLEVIKASRKPVSDGHTGSTDFVPSSARGHSDRVLRALAESGGVVGIHFADHLFTEKVWGTKYSVHAPNGHEPRLWKYNRWLLKNVLDADERARLRKNRQLQEKFFRDNNLPPDPALEYSGERLATIEDMARHIEHLVNVCGEDGVGLGGDVNGITPDSWPLGCDHVGELPHLSAELLARGWSESQLEKFLSHNWRRVWRECLPA
jgi:microsomal dipeptidase-like Zn-dependent dipeptidase